VSQRDGPSCPGCGLPNYEGLCPHCRGDQDAFERELVPPFETTIPYPDTPTDRARLAYFKAKDELAHPHLHGGGDRRERQAGSDDE
jgi:hypothetical protein